MIINIVAIIIIIDYRSIITFLYCLLQYLSFISHIYNDNNIIFTADRYITVL